MDSHNRRNKNTLTTEPFKLGCKCLGTGVDVNAATFKAGGVTRRAGWKDWRNFVCSASCVWKATTRISHEVFTSDGGSGGASLRPTDPPTRCHHHPANLFREDPGGKEGSESDKATGREGLRRWGRRRVEKEEKKRREKVVLKWVSETKWER